jgi:hypothetical protein|nr:MAG TPA: hypothetical protein [Caudoviricetes sp.]
MKEDIMQRLTVTLNALNSVSVSGKANLANLSGSIAMLEEIASLLNSAVITPNEDATDKNK